MDDRDVIKAFVEYRRKNGYPGLKVGSWPEDNNPSTPEIDAIAGPFAIEHTSVDTIPNQRRDADRFRQVVGGLRSGLEGIIPARLNITIDYGAIEKGQDWSAIKTALREWIVKSSPALSDGRHVVNGVPGIPFPIHVTKASDRPPGVFIGRFEPKEDDSFPTRIRKRLDRKAEKLAKYHEPGTTTILLVESGDIALMNEGIMFDGIRRAYPEGLPQGVDEIWYADTSVPTDIQFVDFTKDLWNHDLGNSESITRQ